MASEAAAIVNGSRTASCGAASLDTDKHSDTRLLALVPPLIARLLLDMPKDDVYIDNAHFQPWVYHEISQLLLNVLTARRVHSAWKYARPTDCGRAVKCRRACKVFSPYLHWSRCV